MSRGYWEARRMSAVPFSGIRKIFQAAVELEREGKDVIHLEVGRPDFDTPEHIKEAAKQALDEGFVHYTSRHGGPDIDGEWFLQSLLDDGLAAGLRGWPQEPD